MAQWGLELGNVCLRSLPSTSVIFYIQILLEAAVDVVPHRSSLSLGDYVCLLALGPHTNLQIKPQRCPSPLY